MKIGDICYFKPSYYGAHSIGRIISLDTETVVILINTYIHDSMDINDLILIKNRNEVYLTKEELNDKE